MVVGAYVRVWLWVHGMGGWMGGGGTGERLDGHAHESHCLGQLVLLRGEQGLQVLAGQGNPLPQFPLQRHPDGDFLGTRARGTQYSNTHT